MDADELRRDARRLEDFHEEVGKLSAALGVRALEVEQGLKSGFQRVRALLDEREKELVAQVSVHRAVLRPCRRTVTRHDGADELPPTLTMRTQPDRRI